MPSTPSPRLRAELQALGENLNTWGDGRLNAALTRLEEAIADVVPIAVTGTSYVLTSTNYVADEARGAALVITGTLTGNTTVTAPTVEKLYLIDNRTTQGGFSLTIKTAAGTGYALRPGPQWVFCDGTDFTRGGPRLDQMPLPTGPVDMNTQRLTNLATPTATTDAATKAYADAQAASVSGYASAAATSAGNAATSATNAHNSELAAAASAAAAQTWDPTNYVPKAGANLTGALNETAVTVASAATADIGAAAGNAVRVTGTTTITALGTAQSGARRHVTFSGALTLTHNATSLILPGAANIVTAAGDTAEFESLGSGNWRCMEYNRASGVALPAIGNVLAVPVTPKVASVTWSSTITLDLTAGNKFPVTLGGATTFANPTITAAMVGMEFTIIPTQDGTGSRTASFGSYFKFPNGTAPTASTAAGKRDRVICEVVSTTAIDAVYVKGF
ncbi:hypothetical protein E6C67_26770 [Azospirillum sp. TSA2s]|uniref:hypothetical protein n=1 Tax=Azospirillum sp. TSA2s TaxID=709810 RepID=UPI0010AA7120|nr:hypothetical protein [Azospirillum sp. TSA2s]QCG97379.1 hypothetical protein E6C67_26770 [Azospirillum sp. TSA2s]